MIWSFMTGGDLWCADEMMRWSLGLLDCSHLIWVSQLATYELFENVGHKSMSSLWMTFKGAEVRSSPRGGGLTHYSNNHIIETNPVVVSCFGLRLQSFVARRSWDIKTNISEFVSIAICPSKLLGSSKAQISWNYILDCICTSVFTETKQVAVCYVIQKSTYF